MDSRFECVEEKVLQEQNHTHATLFRHKKTGAQIVSCINTDENKVFGVTFRTPVDNSTGVPHILEHSVLCGSKKYPVKEPFVVLLKSSLQTFLNAFTYPDKTCYPVASTNLQDFYNLIDVYLDAVFYPRITEDIFQQEGWHIEAHAMDAPLNFTGVVYNEMKGVYSSPESYLAEKTQHSVFPDTIYSVDSGGEPTAIRTLTYEDFLAFHRRFYHPSNARFYFWGDDPVTRRFEILGDLLDSYTATEPHSTIPMQKSYTPKQYIFPYASKQTENASMVTCSWLLPETTDVLHNFAFEVLDYILLGMPGSPLRRALIESGLGTDITGGGLHSELQQMYFSVGLKGVAKENIQKVEECIFSTFRSIVNEGIQEESIHAALTNIEFTLRENNTERYPVGLALMVRSLTTWLYDASPFSLMAFEEPLAILKSKSPAYFTELIARFFLENTSRTVVVLHPDATLEEKQRMEEQQALSMIEEKLSQAEKADLIQKTAAFLERQAEPDAPEALATIPSLCVQDVNKHGKEYPLTYSLGKGVSVVPTAGIVYIDMYFSLEHVAQRVYPLLPLFARAMTEMGTKKYDYTALGIQIACKTGDIDFSVANFVEHGTLRCKPYFFAEIKAVEEKLDDAMQLFIEILTEPSFADKDRFMQIVKEEKARLEQSIIPAGHTFALSRLSAQYGTAGVWSETLGGLCYLRYVEELLHRCENDWGAVLHDLTTLHNTIILQGKYAVHTTCSESSLSRTAAPLQMLVTAFPAMCDIDDCAITMPLNVKRNEAYITQSQVQYMAKAVDIFEHGITYHGAFAVACKYLRMGYLWEKVRVQGGAYGAFISCNSVTGLLSMASYRDPAATKTLEVFDAAAAHLHAHTFSKREIEQLIIATIGDLDMYLLPQAQGRVALARRLAHSTVEERERIREQVLSATEKDIKSIVEALEVFKNSGTVVAIGGKTLEEACTHNTEYTVEYLLV